MSGLWRDTANHDIGEVYENEYSQYHKDHVGCVRLHNDKWYLVFESGWQIGTFESVNAALYYALEKYRGHIRMV